MSPVGRRSQLPRAGSVRGEGGACRMAPDPWFSTYDSTCQIAQDIAEKIQERIRYERNGENTTKLTVTIRALLQNLKEKIALLKDLLLRAVSTHQMYPLQEANASGRTVAQCPALLPVQAALKMVSRCLCRPASIMLS
ncbi:Syntaxin-8 [Galemys pyrenaicus]|uniref:Syntaxin-8 n=1 Tax=Galemys pyrenaicus TaxID=202257 RepID=A0A8J5ZV65_GALPY|nr:Syntaxin-8 [Galemys pyrenaicus]